MPGKKSKCAFHRAKLQHQVWVWYVLWLCAAGKTGISGKSLRSFWRWILRTLQALLLTENILETIETVKKVLNNRSVSQHNISSRMSELQSQRSDDAHIVAIRGCAINILHHSDGLNCTFSIVPRYLTLSCSWYRHILFYFCKWILVWYIQHYCNYYKKKLGLSID